MIPSEIPFEGDAVATLICAGQLVSAEPGPLQALRTSRDNWLRNEAQASPSLKRATGS